MDTEVLKKYLSTFTRDNNEGKPYSEHKLYRSLLGWQVASHLPTLGPHEGGDNYEAIRYGSELAHIASKLYFLYPYKKRSGAFQGGCEVTCRCDFVFEERSALIPQEVSCR